MKRAVATEIAVAGEFVDNDVFGIDAVQWSPGPRAFLHTAAGDALQYGLCAHRHRRVRWHIDEAHLSWN